MNQNTIHFNMPKIYNGPQTWNLYQQHIQQDVVVLWCKNLCIKFLEAAMVRMNQMVDRRGDQTLYLRISLVELGEGHHAQYCLFTVVSIKPEISDKTSHQTTSA
jgi:hypothetical protein